MASIAFFAGLLVVLGGHSQTTQKKLAPQEQVLLGQSPKEIDDAASPVVDLTNPETSDRLDKNTRKQKNARHDKSGPVKIDVYPKAGEVRADPERRAGFSDLPIDKSDVIVEAVVAGARAFLSDDKTGIYSEFTILVSNILKIAPDVSVNIGDKIVAERSGGRVRYPSGQIVRWRISREGVPIVGKKYLFFLARADQDSYALLTGYEIQGDKVFALDGSRTESGRQGASIFDRHNGQDLDVLMGDVKKVISARRE